MPAAPVRVVLIGNSFAARAQLPALRWAGDNDVIGIAGADALKARRTADEWEIPTATGHWEELLGLDPELVIVTTPVDLHAPIVSAALETRAAILCEKPFTLDVAEARELVDAAAGRLALVDHQLRWSPWRRRLRELVRDGYLGTPWSARLAMNFGSARRIGAPYSWWYDASRGGGALGAIGSHMIDSLVNDLGPVESVRARLATYVETRDDREGAARGVTADEHALLWLRMVNGMEVELETNLMAPHGIGSRIEYVGSEGVLHLVREEKLSGAHHGEELGPFDVDAEIPSPEELGMDDTGIFGRVLPLYLRDVVRAVQAGEAELPGAATFEDGLRTMAVIDAARRSAAGETWVPCAP